jgi:hypothetical protein
MSEEEWTSRDVDRFRRFPYSHPQYEGDNIAHAHNESLKRVVAALEKKEAVTRNTAVLQAALEAAHRRYDEVHAIAVEKDRLWSEACNERNALYRKVDDIAQRRSRTCHERD